MGRGAPPNQQQQQRHNNNNRHHNQRAPMGARGPPPPQHQRAPMGGRGLVMTGGGQPPPVITPNHNHQQKQQQHHNNGPRPPSSNPNSGIPYGHVPGYLPGSSSLVEELDKRLLLVLRDGRHILGVRGSEILFCLLDQGVCSRLLFPRSVFFVGICSVTSVTTKLLKTPRCLFVCLRRVLICFLHQPNANTSRKKKTRAWIGMMDRDSFFPRRFFVPLINLATWYYNMPLSAKFIPVTRIK
jgi:hypothetical protein